VQQAPDDPLAFVSDYGLPLLVLAGLLVVALGAGKLSQSEPKMSALSNVGTTFDDVPDYVPGNIEAKEELQTVVAFLKKPEVFQKLGAKVPRGVLLTGLGDKAHMARAIAGESGVPLLQIASRDSPIREAFAEACEQAPCVVFIPLDGQHGDEKPEGELATQGKTDNAFDTQISEQRLNDVLQGTKDLNSSEVVFVAASNKQDVLENSSRFFELEVVVEPEPDWAAGFALATYVSQNGPPGRQGRVSGKEAPWRDVKVLELGSGTGMAGIAAASVGADVLLTDSSRLVPLMSRNINVNRSRIDVGSIACAAFEWGQVEKPPVDVSKQSWDVMLGADLVRDAASVPLFADTLAFLLGPLGAAAGGTAIYAHRPRSSALDEDLQAALGERGLTWRVLPPLPPQASDEASPWSPAKECKDAAGADEVVFWELQGSSAPVTAEMLAQVLQGQRHKAGGMDEVPEEFWEGLAKTAKSPRS
jgi:hypothetical protein